MPPRAGQGVRFAAMVKAAWGRAPIGNLCAAVLPAMRTNRTWLLAAVLLVLGLGAAARAQGPFLPRGVFVGVDASGAIEAWVRKENWDRRARTRSRATYRAADGAALMYCAPGELLAVTVAEHFGDVPVYADAPTYRCPAGHALAARATGELVCAPYLATRPATLGDARRPGLAAEMLTGGQRGLALLGECAGQGGPVLPAFFAPASDPPAAGPCPTSRSSASYNGTLRAGGCVR